MFVGKEEPREAELVDSATQKIYVSPHNTAATPGAHG